MRGRTATWLAVAVAAGIATSGCVPAADAAGAPSTTASAPPPPPETAGAVEVAPPTAAAAATPSSAPAAEVTTSTLRQGDRGPAVLALQQRLSELGYWLGTPDGSYGHLTTQAVYALQGAAGLDRDGAAGPAVRAALDAGTRPQASTTSGRVTEVDRERGLLLFVDDGAVQVVLHTSTGTFERYTHDGRTFLADTPEGTFRVTWSQDGWREGDLGRLYRPRYFHPDGIAVHGYGSVPAQPASHGCARVALAAMDMIWARDLMPLGSTVVVR